ncbi:MAG: S1 family peptidase [Elusimicrobiota bacterium]|jgi:hypothetical protein|nr:S1 family peptidase [Elusimicrobiota bacterium]
MKKLVAFACIVLFSTSAYAFNMAAQKIDKNMEAALQTALNDGYQMATKDIDNEKDMPPSVLITSKKRFIIANTYSAQVYPSVRTQTCGATFVSNKWLLTHKHCVEARTVAPQDNKYNWTTETQLVDLEFTVKAPGKKARAFYMSFPYTAASIAYEPVKGTDLVLINMENIKIDKTNKTLSSEIGGDNLFFRRLALSAFPELSAKLDSSFLEKTVFFTHNYPNAKFNLSSNIMDSYYTMKNKSKIEVQKIYPGEPIYFRNKANNKIVMFGINNASDTNKELYIPMDKTLANRINKIIQQGPRGL